MECKLLYMFSWTILLAARIFLTKKYTGHTIEIRLPSTQKVCMVKIEQGIVVESAQKILHYTKIVMHCCQVQITISTKKFAWSSLHKALSMSLWSKLHKKNFA